MKGKEKEKRVGKLRKMAMGFQGEKNLKKKWERKNMGEDTD